VIITAVEAGSETKSAIAKCFNLARLRFAWNAVQPSTISGYFKHCGFDKEPFTELHDKAVGAHDTDMHELEELLSVEVSWNDYLEVDQQVATSEFMTDDDIVKAI